MTQRKHHAEFAVIGLGRFGSSLALTLIERGFHVLGIDRDHTIVQKLSDKMTQIVELDSTDEEALTAVDITSFATVIVAIGSNFEANLMTTVALKALNVEHVICKALNERQRTILLRVGADRVILPEFEAGRRLAQELAAPGMVDQIALGADHSITELRVPRSFIGQSILDADLRRRFGITILAIKRDDLLTVAPPPNYTFISSDILAVIGENSSIARLSAML